MIYMDEAYTEYDLAVLECQEEEDFWAGVLAGYRAGYEAMIEWARWYGQRLSEMWAWYREMLSQVVWWVRVWMAVLSRSTGEETMSEVCKRAQRLVAIRDMLAERAYTAEELAREFEVDRDTICRDLVDLQIPPLNVSLAAEGGKWMMRTPGGP